MSASRVRFAMATTLLVAGCTGGDTTGDTDGTDTVAAAQAFVESEASGLSAEQQDSLVVGEVERGDSVDHVHFQQTVDGHPVQGAEVVVHVLGDGTVQGITDQLTDAQPADTSEMDLTEAQAVDVAEKAIEGTPEGEATAASVWVQDGTTLHLAWQVTLQAVEPVGTWTVTVDAMNGDVLQTERLTIRDARPGHKADPPPAAAPQAAVAQVGDACAVADTPGACIFNPDPVYANGGVRPDPDDTNGLLTAVELRGLTDQSQLVGTYVDAQPPFAPQPPREEADGTWAIGRGQPGFEAAMSYYWIDAAHGFLERLGFEDVLADEPFPVVALDPETVDNAFYDPGGASGPAIYLGVGSDGINEGEDAAGIVHEYGHAVLDAMAPNISSAEGSAYHEGFGDLLAFFVTLEGRLRGPEEDLACLFWWTEEGVCLRRVDEDRVYPDGQVFEPHVDGEIWSGAIYDVWVELGGDTAARDRVLGTLLEANNFLTPSMSFADATQAFLNANDARHDGDRQDEITAILAEHGFTTDGSTMSEPAGPPVTASETTSGVRVEVAISHSWRGDLLVHAGVADRAGNKLCDVAIAEPNRDDGSTDLGGQFDASACAAFIPPGPDQRWYLTVEDTLPEDVGDVTRFIVWDDETSYLATGLPLPIPDADPTGVAVTINGPGSDMTNEPTSTTAPATGAPYVHIEIDHTYIGDLLIRTGVADREGTILCSVVVRDPLANDGTQDLVVDIDVSECGEYFPPSLDARWFVGVLDTADEDEGAIVAFAVTDANGETTSAPDVPAVIADGDADGVVVTIGG